MALLAQLQEQGSSYSLTNYIQMKWIQRQTWLRGPTLVICQCKGFTSCDHSDPKYHIIANFCSLPTSVFTAINRSLPMYSNKNLNLSKSSLLPPTINVSCQILLPDTTRYWRIQHMYLFITKGLANFFCRLNINGRTVD